MKKRNIKIKEILYHGTPTPFLEINLKKGRDYKDFGKGFYLAYTKKQAVGMMNKKARELSVLGAENIKKTLYAFDVDYNILETFNIKVFEEADSEWLDLVLKCRFEGGIPHNYDIIIEPTADDDTAYCLNMYREGVYGNPDSIMAKKTLLNNLEVENLGIQIFIETEKGLNILKNRREIEWKQKR